MQLTELPKQNNIRFTGKCLLAISKETCKAFVIWQVKQTPHAANMKIPNGDSNGKMQCTYNLVDGCLQTSAFMLPQKLSA
jgi:hypothetical protein